MNKDASIAVCHVLEQNGIRCWMAPRDIPPGAEYGDLIDDALKSCTVVVILFSQPASVSPWVKGEINVAFEEQKTIIPFRLDQTPLQGQNRIMLNQRHWIDAYPDYEVKFKDLVAAVAHALGRKVETNGSETEGQKSTHKEGTNKDEKSSLQKTSGKLKACTNSECENFGKYILPADAKFCLKCGKPLTHVEKKPSNTRGQQTMQYVDLGLSVKWATCNLGASSPEEYGDYFAWGEVKPRRGGSWDYDWKSTPYCKNEKGISWSKYTGKDGRKVLDPADDAATVALGFPWRMPTLDEIKELLDKCKWTWTKVNGKEGYKVVGPNGNFIFLPAAGYRSGSSLGSASTLGSYWSSSLNAGSPYGAYDLNFYSADHDGYRYCGRSVRPVRP